MPGFLGKAMLLHGISDALDSLRCVATCERKAVFAGALLRRFDLEMPSGHLWRPSLRVVCDRLGCLLDSQLVDDAVSAYLPFSPIQESFPHPWTPSGQALINNAAVVRIFSGTCTIYRNVDHSSRSLPSSSVLLLTFGRMRWMGFDALIGRIHNSCCFSQRCVRPCLHPVMSQSRPSVSDRTSRSLGPRGFIALFLS
jgi:hypothetical protein